MSKGIMIRSGKACWSMWKSMKNVENPEKHVELSDYLFRVASCNALLNVIILLYQHKGSRHSSQIKSILLLVWIRSFVINRHNKNTMQQIRYLDGLKDTLWVLLSAFRGSTTDLAKFFSSIFKLRKSNRETINIDFNKLFGLI